jgi:hypothetical protein
LSVVFHQAGQTKKGGHEKCQDNGQRKETMENALVKSFFLTVWCVKCKSGGGTIPYNHHHHQWEGVAVCWIAKPSQVVVTTIHSFSVIVCLSWLLLFRASLVLPLFESPQHITAP